MLSESFWEKYFAVYDILNIVIPYKNLLRIIINSLNPEAGEKVLDAGSGTGNLSIPLREAGADVVSLDNSTAAIRAHRKKDASATTIQQDLTQHLPFSDNSFDKIACVLTLHTIERSSRQKLLNELHRVLKDGGKIVLANPSKEFHPVKIYKSHLKEDLNERGPFRVLVDSVNLVGPTILMFYYNYLIHRESKNSEIGMLELDEQKKLLINAGFKNISETKLLYAGTTAYNIGIK
jgi:ubiquinone/menaquinone biosynthesis C-methylase UbiE